MLRLSLILAIVASLGAVAVSQMRVAKKIQTLTSERDDYQARMQAAQSAERKARKEAQQANDKAEQLTGELADTKASLKDVQAKATQQQKRADDLDSKLNTALKERNDAEQKLGKYLATGVTAEQVGGLNAQIKKLRDQRDAFQDENGILQRNLTAMEVKLKRYLGEEVQVKLPKGLKGQVIAVDPKWDFVVLNIGSKQGVLKDGEMMINRNGKLIGKVQITSVQPNRSIANVMPDWKQGNVMEGDEVLY